jgi:predicted Zn-dependent protease
MPPPDDPENSRLARLGRSLRQLGALDARDLWWRFLDALETHRALRRSLYAAVALTVSALVCAVWIYPWWHQRTAVSMARQWLAAGRLDQASEAVRDVLEIAPENPESWKLAADLARRLGNPASALGYTKKALELSPGDADLILTRAADALLANQPDECAAALAALPPDFRARSAHARRIEGELARRRLRLDEARDHFEAALRIDGSDTAVNEVPLGTILLNARDPAARQRGLDLLAKWSPDPEWGANALRTLLADSLRRDDRAAMLRWADALRAHPRCTLGDIPDCLRALSRADESRFSEVLAAMKPRHSGDSANASLLISWLNQIGRHAEARAWIDSLPASLSRLPPAAVAAAESLRLSTDWRALSDWTSRADWGRHLESLRLAYALLAAVESGQDSSARELRATLRARTDTDGQRTLFVADSLYAWGLRDDALDLLWKIADEPGIAFNVLGTLARHYQVSRDAAGQHRVFKRLHSLRPQDPAVANNYALFSALTGEDLRQAEQLARHNHRQYPDNPAYLATYAIVLCQHNRALDALALFDRLGETERTSPTNTLAYGLALAGNRRKDEARRVLSTLDRDTLTPEEIRLVEAAVR